MEHYQLLMPEIRLNIFWEEAEYWLNLKEWIKVGQVVRGEWGYPMEGQCVKSLKVTGAWYMLRLTNLLDEEMKRQGTSKERQAEKINYKEICVSS